MQLRQTSLRVLFYLHQLDSQKLSPLVLQVMYDHRIKLVKMLEDDPNGDTAAYVKEELEIVDDVIAAPNRPFKSNFTMEAENYSAGPGVLNLTNWTGQADGKKQPQNNPYEKKRNAKGNEKKDKCVIFWF